MRVIKVGRNHEEWAREFECEGCGAIVEVMRSDVYLEATLSGRSMRENVYANCCECAEKILIDVQGGRWKNI